MGTHSREQAGADACLRANCRQGFCVRSRESPERVRCLLRYRAECQRGVAGRLDGWLGKIQEQHNLHTGAAAGQVQP
jgi:hypothetical protein